MKRYRVDFGYGRYYFEERADGDWMRFEDHEAIIRRQAAAALSGMDAAKATSSRQLELAQKARAESSPDALESERQANAKLTQELSLAEEGLANYAQEVAELKKDKQQYSDWVTPQLERLGREMVENDRLKPLADAAIAYVKCWKQKGHAGLDEWTDLFNAVERSRQPQKAEHAASPDEK